MCLCSVIFWFGDLNYRLSDMDTEVVRKLATSGRYEDLLKNDQLLKQMSLKKCFSGYKEGMITFKPTYKYDPGSDNWDTRYVLLLCCPTPPFPLPFPCYLYVVVYNPFLQQYNTKNLV